MLMRKMLWNILAFFSEKKICVVFEHLADLRKNGSSLFGKY